MVWRLYGHCSSVFLHAIWAISSQVLSAKSVALENIIAEAEASIVNVLSGNHKLLALLQDSDSFYVPSIVVKKRRIV